MVQYKQNFVSWLLSKHLALQITLVDTDHQGYSDIASKNSFG